jgi:cellulose synthase/poly-beta-1,6-N-acetylglucosamine synthase-like glycosyltransferase
LLQPSSPPMTVEKLSIIIPAYNEERTIHLILDQLRV